MNKNVIVALTSALSLGVGAFAISTNYVDKSLVVDNYKTTVDGSYVTKTYHVTKEKLVENAKDDTETFYAKAGNVKPTPGLSQGLWSNSSGGNVTPEQFNELTRQTYGKAAQSWIDCFGLAMDETNARPVSVSFDPVRDKYGEPGLIHWLQGNTSKWAGLNQNLVSGGHSTISSSGCGPTGLSIIFSSMLRKYITPAEVIAARDNYDKRHPGDSVAGMRNSGNTGAMKQSSKDVCKLVGDLKYRGESLLQCTLEGMNKSRVDETLDAGGMVLFVAHSGGTGSYWTGGGHYVVIRARNGETYYTADGSHDSSDPVRSKGNHDVGHPWADIDNSNHRNVVHYVTPGPGYSNYIEEVIR